MTRSEEVFTTFGRINLYLPLVCYYVSKNHSQIARLEPESKELEKFDAELMTEAIEVMGISLMWS